MQYAEDFKQYMNQRERASRAFVNGDGAPLLSVSTHVSPASIYGPSGNTIEGADNVNAANAENAQRFGSGSVTHLEIQQMSTADLAFWVGVQRSTMRIKDSGKAVAMDLRVTDVFRRESGEWNLIHRHADPLKSSPQ